MKKWFPGFFFLNRKQKKITPAEFQLYFFLQFSRDNYWAYKIAIAWSLFVKLDIILCPIKDEIFCPLL